jgi:hypothetical protein
MRTANLLLASILIGFSFLIFGLTLGFPNAGPDSIGLGPASFPRLLAVCLSIISLQVLIASLKSKETSKLELDYSGAKRLLYIIMIIILYGYALQFLGFAIPTIGFLAILNVLLSEKNRRKRYTIIFALVTTVLVYIVFRLILGISMPRGLWIPI